jgi:hypothetical protein
MRFTHIDKPMHQVRRVESKDKALWWWGYFTFTRRTYYWRGIPIWQRDIEEEERPITELIRRAIGG